MAITRIEATYLEIPLPADFHPSWVPGLTQQHNRCLVVEVHDDSGHVGVGAGAVFEEGQARFGKFVAVDTIGRFLMGADPFAIESHAKLIARFAFMVGGRPWPLECALWDLQAKIAGVPLWQEPWLNRFSAAARVPHIQYAQNEVAVARVADPAARVAMWLGLICARSGTGMRVLSSPRLWKLSSGCT